MARPRRHDGLLDRGWSAVSAKVSPPSEEEQCRSMRKVHLRQEGQTIYLRCKKHEDHEGRWHEQWMKKWTDENEDGWLEDEGM